MKSFNGFYLAIVALFTLTGCGTVNVITSDPKEADVALLAGGVVGRTPFETPKISFFTGSKNYNIQKTDYVTKRIVVQPGGQTEHHVVLEKYFPKVTVNSVPQGADVLNEAGESIGQTPTVIHVTEPTQNYTLQLLSYRAKKLALTPKSEESVTVNLGEQIAGMVYQEILVTDKGIELVSETVFADQNVIEKSPSVRAVRRLTDFPATRLVGSLAIFPDDKKIMMDVLDQELDESGKMARFSNIWSQEVTQDGRLQRWTDGRYFDETPCFSSDGKHLYFSSTRSGSFSIFRMSTEHKRGLGLVTSGATLDRHPEIPPQGDQIIWTAYVPQTTTPQLWSLPLNEKGLPGGLPMQLREGKGPKWSPDGKHILYSVLDRNINKWKIWMMEPDGSNPTQITTGSNANDIDPQWSHDGSRILFASDRGVSNGIPNYDIWIMNSDGSDPRQLTTNGSRDDKPVISQDGKTVYFRSNRGLKWDVWVMEIVDHAVAEDGKG